jgi:hypothetical protein
MALIFHLLDSNCAVLATTLLKKRPYALFFQKHFYLCLRPAQDIALSGVSFLISPVNITPIAALANCHKCPGKNQF